MCGILGFNWEDEKLIRAMADLLQHRGPDDYGFYVDRHVSLGHRRLSIIDLSEKGRNPIFNEKKDVCVVFNGEIYNFKDVRKELEKKGHRFYSDTDSEVIVHAYEEYGLECVKRFNGMFAFAIYDCSNNKIIIARDRLGVKPLYYYYNNGDFIFASEIKALLLHDIRREVNLNSFSKYLSFRYVPEPETLFKNIYALEPGHLLVLEDKKLSKKKYWEFKIQEPDFKLEEYYIETYRQMFEEAVKKRLISDVPLGAYISGGIDSSSILAMMAKHKAKINTFTVGFGSALKADELEKARTISELFGTNHHELVIEPKHLKALPKIIWHLDQPIGDAIIIANYYLSQMTKKHVTVVMTGEGSDETMAGYLQYRNIKLGHYVNKYLPKLLRKNILPNLVNRTPVKVLDKFFDYPESLGKEGRKRLAEYIRNLEDMGKSYLNHVVLFDEKNKKLLLKKDIPGQELIAKDLKKNFSQACTADDIIDNIITTEIKTWLPSNILFRLDKMSMAHGVEGRVPFLDYELVEFTETVPASMKIRGMTEKYLLRQAMKKELPREILQRKKQAFYLPTKKEYDNEIMQMAQQVLSESEIRKGQYFHYDYIKRLILDSKQSRFLYSKQLISLMNFELWHKTFIETDDFKKPSSIKMQ